MARENTYNCQLNAGMFNAVMTDNSWIGLRH